MIISNLTNQIQEISVIDRHNNSLTYTIYVRAKSSLDIDKDLVILNLDKLIQGRIISVEGSVFMEPQRISETEKVTQSNTEITPQESEISEESSAQVENESEESSAQVENESEDVLETEEDLIEDTTEESTPISEGVILCDICNKEFASERSLALHKTKSHK